MQALRRAGVHLGVGALGAVDPAEQLGEAAGEVLRVLLAVAERPAYAVGEPHGTAEPHVDPAGEEGGEHPELLGHDERLVVGEHHPAGPDPDGGGRAGDGGGQDRRRRPRDARHAVVFGDPEAVVAQRLHLPRQRHGVAECLGAVVPRTGAGAVQEGEPGRSDHRAHTLFNAPDR
ncbi:hypothetical protein SMICM17S_01352 [Streptomyces microflavus]